MAADLQSRLQAALGDTYRIERRLGEGGMATVYLAEDLKHRRKVAVKVLRSDLAAALGAERFLREIEIAAQLQHPHILTLIDSGEADGFLYYVMPYVEGESLRAKLAREGELPVTDAVRLLREIVDALSSAHRRGVVHRDIKPDNVLLSEGHAIITDFGVAKAVSEATGRQQLTTAGVALGTPAYMAPEQATADPHIDHRADIYAVGALAYELLTGRPPFTGTTPQVILSAHVTEAPDPVTKHRATVPPALATLVMKCLEKKPADRWQGAEELLPQLEALATPSGGITPTDTRPVGAVQARRRRTLVGAGGLVGAVALAASGWWLFAGRGGPAAGQSGGRIPIAVLVFENRSAADDEEYFSEGIADDISTQLSKVGGFAVKAHASARRLSRDEMNYGEIAEELGVDYLVHGNWRRAGDSVRITAQLIVPETEEQLWADNYNRELTAANLFGVRSDVAEHVASALNVAVAPSAQAQLATPPTASMEALSAYQLGRFFWNQRTEEGIRRAVDHFTAAIAADADYALAYAGLAEAYVVLPLYSSADPVEASTAARAAAEKALAIDGTLGEAYASLGLVSHLYDWDLEGAENAFGKAVSLNPDYATAHQWYGGLLHWVGRVDEAEREARRAQELDPLSTIINWNLGVVLRAAGRYDEAVEQYRKSLELDPNSMSLRSGLGYVYLDKGMIDEARAEFERLDDNLWFVPAYVRLGDRERALRVYGDRRERAGRVRVSKVLLADAALALADTGAAFEWLAGAVEDRDPEVWNFSFEPWRSLRGDARFRRILNSMGLDAGEDGIVPLENGREP